MNSPVLLRINNFIKNRAIELVGILLVFLSLFLLAAFISYSPSDPNFIYSPSEVDIKNIGGFYGSVIADFLLQSLGLISIFIVFNFFYWGTILITKKIVINFVLKSFFLLIYIILGSLVLNSKIQSLSFPLPDCMAVFVGI